MWTVNAGHFGAEVLGELDGERAGATSSSVHQNLRTGEIEDLLSANRHDAVQARDIGTRPDPETQRAECGLRGRGETPALLRFDFGNEGLARGYRRIDGSRAAGLARELARPITRLVGRVLDTAAARAHERGERKDANTNAMIVPHHELYPIFTD